MITQKLLKAYKSYDGDGDRYFGYGNTKSASDYQSWQLLVSILQDLQMAKRNLVSEEYKKALEAKILQNCDSEETVAQLMAMANSDNSREKKPWWKFF